MPSSAIRAPRKFGPMSDEILKHFASAAATYDEHAKIQQSIALDLLRRCPSLSLPESGWGHGGNEVYGPSTRNPIIGQGSLSDQGRQPRRILDAGCGTGHLTRLLASTYPDAHITAVDFSDAMLKVAAAAAPANVRFLQADIRDIPDTGFDLIASNAALQWLPDVDEAVRSLHARLTPGGTLALSYFGPETYRELRSALTAALGHPVTLPSDTFASPSELNSIIHRHFPAWSLDTIDYTETFPTLRALLANIKATGTRGHGASPKVAWTPGLLRRVEAEYRAVTGGEIVVTYQVSFCIGRSVRPL